MARKRSAVNATIVRMEAFAVVSEMRPFRWQTMLPRFQGYCCHSTYSSVGMPAGTSRERERGYWNEPQLFPSEIRD